MHSNELSAFQYSTYDDPHTVQAGISIAVSFCILFLGVWVMTGFSGTVLPEISLEHPRPCVLMKPPVALADRGGNEQGLSQQG
jgi:hypothetical protein